VGLGGTFDILHEGHKELLRKALEVGSKVQIGLSSDRFVRKMRKSHEINPYEVRAENLRRFLRAEEALKRTEVIPIDDEYGPAIISADLEALVVSRESLHGGKRINEIRQQNGLPPLKLIIVPMVLAEDGRPISTRRIRSGAISPTGEVKARRSKKA
jgi:pantetheine-phosphate adenylyltransferase